MLVLTRKLNEKVVIGGNIVVSVVRIDHNQIRLGIHAPRDVTIFREEIRPDLGSEPSGVPAVVV